MRNSAEIRHLAYMRGKEVLQATGLPVETVVSSVREEYRLSEAETTELTNALKRWAEG